MSLQDHRSSQSASLGEQSTLNGCMHNQQMQRPTSPPVQKISRVPPPAPKLSNATSTEIASEHNCSCTHHHNILPQHYHHHHHHHQTNCTQNVGFGQSRQHQMSPPAQHEQNNEPNQSAVETHMLASHHHSNVGHHSYIPFNLSASSQNVCQNCECGHGSAHELSGRSSRIVSTDENNPSGSEDSGRKCSNRMKKLTNDEQHNGVENKQVENSSNGRITSNRSDEMKFINRIERYSDIVEAAIKNTEGDILTEEELGPPLPPRPPPRIRNVPTTDNVD